MTLHEMSVYIHGTLHLKNNIFDFTLTRRAIISERGVDANG